MTVKSVLMRGNLSASTDRGPSRSIWGDCPVQEIIEQPDKGMYFFDDFLVTGQWATTNTTGQSMGQWGSYGSTGSLHTPLSLEGGVVGLNSDAADESATIASTVGSARITTTSTLALNGKLWFECRVGFGTIAATKMDCFIGLADLLLSSDLMTNTLPISTTDDTLSTVPNLIGFHKKTSAPTEINFVYQLAGGTAVYPTGLTTLMNTVTGAVLTAVSGATGFVKLGFVFDPGAYSKTISTASTGQTAGGIARPLITVYVNGLAAPAFLTSTNVQGNAFPTGFMGPVASCMQAGAGANTFYVDWIRMAQIANT
jgi:hypothetical protein